MSALEPNLYKWISKDDIQKDVNINKFMPQVGKQACAIFVGNSGSGKSNSAVFAAIESGIYTKIIIFKHGESKDPLYDQWKKNNDADPKTRGKVCIEYNIENFNEENFRALGKIGPVLLIIDDFVVAPKVWQKKVESYVIRCRKDNVMMYLLVQSFFKLDRVIRLQGNMLILKRNVTNVDLQNIARDLAIQIGNIIIDYKMLIKIYMDAMNVQLEDKQDQNTLSLVLDPGNSNENLRIRFGFYNGISKDILLELLRR